MFDYAKQKPVREYVAYFMPGDKRGSIAVYEEGIVLREGRTETAVRNGYVQSIERVPGGVVLGKAEARIDYYNLFGNKEVVTVKMRESDVAALKKDVGK